MAYPTAAGVSSLTGTYIPVIWSSKMVLALYDNTCMSEILNTEFESEIQKFGDEIKINDLPDIAINDFVDGMDLEYEDLNPAVISMLINKGKYWAFPAGIIAKNQSKIEFVERWSAHAGKTLKISTEASVFASIYADAHASNKGITAGAESGDINLGVSGTPLALTKDNIHEVIIDCGICFDEQSVPEDNRNLVLPPWAIGMIKKGDLKDSSLTGDDKSIIRTGRVGMVDRMNIWSSTLLTTGTDGATVWNSFAVQKNCCSFAAQITENEKITNPKSFGELIRGLLVFGYRTTQPKGMLHLYIRKG